jgi:antitoxin HicB
MTKSEGARYTTIVQWSPDDATYIASHPELPDCIGVGDTRDMAIMLLEEATRAWVDSAGERGAQIPEPLEDRYSGKFSLRIPPSLHRALAMRAIAEHTSLNQLVGQLLGAAIQPPVMVRRVTVSRASTPLRYVVRSESNPLGLMMAHGRWESPVVSTRPSVRRRGMTQRRDDRGR